MTTSRSRALAALALAAGLTLAGCGGQDDTAEQPPEEVRRKKQMFFEVRTFDSAPATFIT